MKNYLRRKDKIIEFLGGKCIECDTKDDLCIEHKDKKLKNFDILHNHSIAWNKLEKELYLCHLICYECRSIRSSKEKSLSRRSRGGARPNSGPKPKYNWSEVQTDYDLNNLSVKEIRRKYKIASQTMAKAQKRGDFTKRPRKIERVLSGSGEVCSRAILKKSLIKYGFLKNECSECAQKPEWHGKPLVMVLDHINGNTHDDRIENTRLLCPNCNSQMPTYCGRNKKYKGKTPVVQLARIADFDSADCGSSPHGGANEKEPSL